MEQPLNTDQTTLVAAWQERLPDVIDGNDSFTVQADAASPNSLLLHFNAAGRQEYSLDFRCTYVDNREVQVQLVDVEKAGRHEDEHTAAVQQLASHYTRQIHECAQSLQDLTNP
ncbi:hypothetical protein F4V43_10800 [Paenibacillus spiritus]|uniref:Uncharacterized protein n=1 Tax=Paenibacillus spiritus TaxID=2496557 RepID=A0A5J5G8Z5_9BACL|nr:MULTISPECIES: hypothetical protein [Paenibacillus]KAA9004659.1 hypothetical protein F4V43_10800 [Paenibacillus spiritus]